MKNLLHHFTASAVLLLTTNAIFAQAPTLGTAANFELFTATGAVTNTGISQVTAMWAPIVVLPQALAM